MKFLIAPCPMFGQKQLLRVLLFSSVAVMVHHKRNVCLAEDKHGRRRRLNRHAPVPWRARCEVCAAPPRRHTPWVARKVLHSIRKSRRFGRIEFHFDSSIDSSMTTYLNEQNHAKGGKMNMIQTLQRVLATRMDEALQSLCATSDMSGVGVCRLQRPAAT